MSAVVRLTLVSHAMTDAMAAGRFPDDEPLNSLGRRQLEAVGIGGPDVVLTAPEARARETADGLGLAAVVDDRLADLDCGSWRGRRLDELPPDELARWWSEPDSHPHGGESIVEVIARMRDWLAGISATTGRTVAVTHPAVIRAAQLTVLDAPPKSFWRIDIAPASRITLHFRGSCWTLRSGFDQR